MGTITPSQQERTAVERVLQSGIFDKAPRLGIFFRYICDRYFEGSADQIKEASIALEALGRSSDFDPKKDSIVRVEAHRLRKRLQEYYAGQGADDPLRIVIPNGQYRPHFFARQPEKATKSEDSVTPTAILDGDPAGSPLVLSSVLPEELANRRRTFSLAQWSVLVPIILAGVGLVIFALHGLKRHTFTAGPKTGATEIAGAYSPAPAELRMLAGYEGTPFVDSQGHSWSGDQFYTGGVAEPIPANHFIEGQPDPHLLRAQRSGQFEYHIPLDSGTHELRLYFAETKYGPGNPLGGADGARMFRILVNGAVLFPLFDVLAEAGAPNRLHIVVLKDVRTASDGKLHLRFEPVVGSAILNGIEILQSSPGRIHPVRIVTQPTPVTDSDGRWWAADEYFYGGTQVCHRQNIINPPEKVLYQGERYGNFVYRIPLAPGKYRLTLHFAETWFGTAQSNYDDVSTRCFDVYANGLALLRNYQVAKDAGGPNRSVAKTFENIEPNAQGTLILEFVPVRNYAELNAIEVVETQ